MVVVAMGVVGRFIGGVFISIRADIGFGAVPIGGGILGGRCRCVAVIVGVRG